MLKFTAISLFVLTTIAQSQACIGEAQMIGKIADINYGSMFSCVVTLTLDSEVTPNPLCPLDITEINATGISLPRTNGHDCDYTIGQTISGIVVSNGRTLRIEGQSDL